jgi:hypothetical protein
MCKENTIILIVQGSLTILDLALTLCYAPTNIKDGPEPPKSFHNHVFLRWASGGFVILQGLEQGVVHLRARKKQWLLY